jgi:general secretion pathway protein G
MKWQGRRGADMITTDVQATEPKQERRLSTFAWVMIVLLVIFGGCSAYVLSKAIHEAAEAAKGARTKTSVLMFQQASEMFYTNVGRWPIALPELVNNTSGIVFVQTFGPAGFLDGWGRPLLYVPPVGTNFQGSITSFGCDGLPGGTNLDADIVLTFP